MPLGRVLMISEMNADLDFGQAVAERIGIPFQAEVAPDKIRRIIDDHSETAVFFNGNNNTVSFGVISNILQTSLPVNQVFLLTDRSIDRYPHLLRTPFFGHHLLRRYAFPAVEFFSQVVGGCFGMRAEGLKPFFPKDAAIKTITLKNSAHKCAAIEALQNTLKAHGIQGRISTLAAQCADELLLNAIFDAPRRSDGTRRRHHLPRNEDFELTEKEQVRVEFAACKAYFGICVTDFFGTLEITEAYQTIREHFLSVSRSGGPEPLLAGFGLHGIVHAGMNLILVADPGKRTDAILILPMTDNVVNFKRGFKFFSIVGSAG